MWCVHPHYAVDGVTGSLSSSILYSLWLQAACLHPQYAVDGFTGCLSASSFIML